jgi:uncharacterized protein DUF4136
MVKLLGCALALLVSATLSATQLPPKEGRIESLKDSKANFASFTTYRWEKAYEAYDKNIHKLIVDTIDAELAARGFKKVEDNSASVSVRYFTVVRTDVMLDKLDEYEKKGLPAPTKTLGRLAIVMRDAKNNRVWAADTVQPLKNEPATRDAEIKQVIARMFATYDKK